MRPSVDKVVLLACTAQCIDQAARKGSVTPHRDHRRDIAYFADAQHALGGADGIQIAHAVAMMTTWSASLISFTS
mgnify:CR=1 FL=1